MKVLDHGYLKLIDVWGSDERVIESARMSTQKGFLGWGSECSACGGTGNPDHEIPEPASMEEAEQRSKEHKDCSACGGKGRVVGDEKLLRYLYEHQHSTPFEFGGMTVEAQAPIFVFREWHRHRVPFGYNEASARYAPLPDLNYVPSIERLMMGSSANRQAGRATGAAALNVASAQHFQVELARMYERQETLYQDALAAGVPKELARVHLPVGRYSKMRATANLRGWLGFLTLRSTAKNPDAQWEIRQYADALHSLLVDAFPRTMELFDGR